MALHGSGTAYGGREFNSEFSSRRSRGETVELRYKSGKIVIALLEALELALIQMFLIWHAVDPL